MSVPSPVMILEAPTLALWTISFLSPSCIPFRPWIAWETQGEVERAEEREGERERKKERGGR